MGSWLPAASPRWTCPALLCSALLFKSTPTQNNTDKTMANSTVMFSGINPEGRNSSKVLRPPGGGSSLGPFSADCEEVTSTKAAPAKAEVPAPTEKVEVVEAPSEAPSAAVEVTENQNIESQPPPAETPTEETPAPAPVLEEAPAPAVAEVAGAPAAAPAPSTVYRPPVAGVRGRVPPGGHTSGPFW